MKGTERYLATLGRMTMKPIARDAAMVVLGIVVLLAPLGAGAGERRADQTRPGYHREEVRRPQVKRSPGRSLPEALRIESLDTEDEEIHGKRNGWSAMARRRATPASLEREAALAAAWAARETVRLAGRRQYYRVGFHAGMRGALEDDLLGRWDFDEGRRLGRRDPDAHRAGSAEGAAAAREAATIAAREQVERQFMDLGREPRHSPYVQAPDYIPQDRWAVPPSLEAVFAETPIPRRGGMAERFADGFGDGRYDPWALHRCSGYAAFFDDRWDDWETALDRWLSDRRRSRSFRKLRDTEQRERFARLFRADFRREIAMAFDREILPAYDRGLEDGWQYGALVNFEWNFRLGYTEGFDRAALGAARASFATTYGPALATEYRGAFDRWSRSARPAVLGVAVLDGNDDGVFQPGETILVDCEIANYGGAPGIFLLELRGRSLERTASTRVTLPRRSVRRPEVPVRAVIRSTTSTRTRTELSVVLDGTVTTVPVLVSYPLEFSGPPQAVDVDALAGRATVEVRVTNRSRKALDGVVDLARVEGYPQRAFRSLERVRPGGVVTASFDLAGLRTVDLLTGDPDLVFEVTSGAEVHDRLGFRFPDRVADLNSDDLLRYMLALSRDPAARRADIAEARRMMLLRLRVDWKAAVRASGNPYKQDYRSWGGATALGALVIACRDERDLMARPEVFDGLGGEIESMARELPGIHPFLRKYVKKLARRIDAA
jgi:hypothetical protein